MLFLLGCIFFILIALQIQYMSIEKQIKEDENNIRFNQKKVIAYVRANHIYMTKIFQQMADPQQKQTIKVEKIFNYLQRAFSLDGFEFQSTPDKQNFLIQKNMSKMEKIIENFYTDFKKLSKQKFYFSKIAITQQEIADLIQYWIKKDNIFIKYQKGETQNNNKENSTIQNNKSLTKESLEQQNVQQNYLKLNAQSLNKINLILENIKQAQSDYEKAIKVQQKDVLAREIQKLKSEVKQIKSKKLLKINIIKNQTENQYQISSPTFSIRSGSIKSFQLREINIRMLFDFYSKQNHITGIHSTFERIEVQSNQLNYPQLVHFLKDFNLQPESKEKVNVFALFQKAASNHKSLLFNQFANLLKDLAHIFIEKQIPDVEKEDIFFNKLFKGENQNSKIQFRQKKSSVKPFHSKETNDFRIKPEQIKYSFQLSPHSGKFIEEIQDQLLKRKQLKEKHKLEIIKKRQNITQKFLKKLSNIDPFNASLVNLKESNDTTSSHKEQTLVNINNLQSYRDSSFDPKLHFKIDQQDDELLSQYAMNRSINYNKSNIQKQLEKSPITNSPQHKRQQSNIQLSPRKQRSTNMGQEMILRALEIQKVQKQKNNSLINSILIQNKKKINQGMEVLQKGKKN